MASARNETDAAITRVLGQYVNMLSNEQVESFRPLEEAMWVSETRGDRAWMDVMLSHTFTEHGQSGQVYTREAILAEPIPERIHAEFPFADFAVRAIEENAVIVTYTVTVSGSASNRVSIWRHEDDRWLLEFHQGTPVPRVVTVDTAELRSASFDMKRRGYSTDGVDRLLQNVADRIDAGDPPSAAEVSGSRFELALRGFDPVAVDSFLTHLRSQLP